MLMARSRMRSIRCCRTPTGMFSQRSILGISRRKPFGPTHRQDVSPRRDRFRSENAPPGQKTVAAAVSRSRFRFRSIREASGWRSASAISPYGLLPLRFWTGGSRFGERFDLCSSYHHYAPDWCKVSAAPLFLPERARRIHPGGAAGGNPAGR